MDKNQVDVKWNEKMSFTTELDGHEIVLDASEEHGGGNSGPRPKQLMLVALGGCTGMDVAAILKKMHVEVEGFSVRVEGELTDEHPRYYRKIHVIYEFRGNDLPMEKIEKAVSLSEERYCGVSALYKKAIEVTSEIKVV